MATQIVRQVNNLVFTLMEINSSNQNKILTYILRQSPTIIVMALWIVYMGYRLDVREKSMVAELEKCSNQREILSNAIIGLNATLKEISSNQRDIGSDIEDLKRSIYNEYRKK